MPTKEPARRVGQRLAPLLAGALAKKVRAEAPKRVREAREKRVASRGVILTEIDGRHVAIGPYPTDAAARQDTARVGGGARVVELLSQTAYFAKPRKARAARRSR